ncbi:MAG: amidohydrolase [Acidobacteria bacterium]|nr:amidohydrolase [Acidobacteriota bacterium]
MRSRRLPFLALCAFALPAYVAAAAPDLIFHSGKIVTVDEQFYIAEALAVEGGRIAAVGSNATILALAGPQTRSIDLQGKTVLPGLIDTHTHPTDAAMYEFDHPVADMETIADVLDYFRERAKVVPEGEWIRLQQVFITRLREQRYPTRAELDEVAPNHAIYFRTGPDASLNTLALELSGIDKDFRIPQGSLGRIERDENGEPTGIIRSGEHLIKFRESQKLPTRADKRRRLKQLIADYNKVGLTSIVDRNASADAVTLYEELLDDNELTARVFLSYAINAQSPLEDIEATISKLSRHPKHSYNPMLWLRGVKFFMDGGMLTGSAYMREPWGVSEVYSITDPGYRGLRFVPPGKAYAITRLALTHGLQPTAHSVGDGAVHAMIDAYEEINDEFRVREMRPCITHSNFMSPEAIEKMAEIGIVADLQPAWLERDGATLLKQFGEARLSYFQPYKSLQEAGVIVGGGSDHMQKIGGMRSINPYNPFFGMWITLQRQPRWSESIVHPEQRLTREEAIRLYTINNAFLTFTERERGSLEAGKLADLIVLDRDILTCPLDQVQAIEVERTYLGGKLVYQQEQ